MIRLLRHTDRATAEKIRALFRQSYAVEAELLRAVDFPPLKRPLGDFMNSTNDFYGLWEAERLIAAVEVDHSGDATHIQSLVVHPEFFRKGLGSRLLEFVFDACDSEAFTVETGLDNEPAKALYKKYRFREVSRWDTDHGVRKVRFERK